MSDCPHHITTSIERDADGNLFQCLLCGSRVRQPGYAPWSAPRPTPSALSEEQISALNSVAIFQVVDPHVFRWIVQRVEWEHGIGNHQKMHDMGIDRIKDVLPA